MSENGLIVFVFVYADNVYGHHHHILHRILYGQNPVGLQSIATNNIIHEAELLKYIQGRKHSTKHKHGSSDLLDIYNPVAHFVNNNYDNSIYDYQGIPNINDSPTSIGDRSNLNLPRHQNAVKNAEIPIAPIVNSINPINPANNGLYLLPNENNRGLQTLENNPHNTSDQLVNTDNPSAVTVGPVQPNINNNANYVIININGKPTLVQVVNLPSINMSNNIQTLPIQGNNDQYILLKKSNIPITDVDNTKTITERATNNNKDEPNNQENGQNNQVNESKEQIRSNSGSYENKQSEFAISTFNSETLEY